jgi:hypothetical protein
MPGHNNWFEINLSKEVNNHLLAFQARLNLAGANLSMSFDQASDYTAGLIASKYNNLHLSLSGGYDSEYVAKVLLRNNIPFTPVILATPHNTDEVWYAKHFCHRTRCTPLIMDFTNNYGKLLTSVIKHAKEISTAPSISFYPHVIADYIGESAHLITGYGDPFAYNNDYDVVLENCFEIEEHDYYLDLSFGTDHPCAFFSYTPELFFALIKNIDVKKNIQAAKSQLYQIYPRIKSISHLHIPDLLRPRLLTSKSKDMKCIKFDQNKLLQLSLEKTIIELKN